MCVCVREHARMHEHACMCMFFCVNSMWWIYVCVYVNQSRRNSSGTTENILSDWPFVQVFMYRREKLIQRD